MKNKDKLALKTIKKKFTLEQWESFEESIKNNPVILLEVCKLITNFTLERKKIFTSNNPQILKYLSPYDQEILVTKENFMFLSDELQNKLIEKNNKTIRFASKKIKKEKISSKPELLQHLVEEEQRKFIKENKFLIPFASEQIQIDSSKRDHNLLSLCTKKVQLIFVKENPNYCKNCNHHLQKELITLKMLNHNKIDIDTLNTYLLVKGAEVSIDELSDFRNKITASNREEKKIFDDYLNYLIINISRNKLN